MRFSLLIFSGILLIACAEALGVDGVAANVQHAWQEEFAMLSNELSSAPAMGLHKKGLSSTNAADENSLIWDTDRDPARVVLRRTRALYNDIVKRYGTHSLPANLGAGLRLLEQRQQTCLAKSATGDAQLAHYLEASGLRRALAIQANPAIDFDSLIFTLENHTQGTWAVSANCYGFEFGTSPLAGIYLLTGLRSGALHERNITSAAVITNGPLAGKRMGDFSGAVHSAVLSYDARTIYFAWVQRALGWGKQDSQDPTDSARLWTDTTCFHIFSMNIDGSNLRQLTFGRRNDAEPCVLPNGRIVFVSDRRNTVARCHPSMLPTAAPVLYSMNADGSDLFPISFHETNELYPSVDNNGMIVYTRWDYIFRDFNAAHSIWLCYPDGRDPRSPHGNYPYPWSTQPNDPYGSFDGKPYDGSFDGKADRPWSEVTFRAIPNTSSKYVAIANRHHNADGRGAVVIIDLAIKDDNRMAQVKKVLADACLPDEDGNLDNHAGFEDVGCTRVYEDRCPWPLSESQFLICRGNNSIWLVDIFGNQQTLYQRSGSLFGDTRFVIPVKARPKPSVLPAATWQGARYALPDHKKATISVVNIYEADIPWPAGVVENKRIKELRIVQIIPRPWAYPTLDVPPIGLGRGSTPVMVLGTVPVEADGSVYCEAPVQRLIYFQAIDENGMALQGMRSGTYVHPGEQLSCTGCHEDKWKAVAPPSTVPIAFRRAPSVIKPEPEGSCPYSYYRLAKPVLDGKCIPCHQEKGYVWSNYDWGIELEGFYYHAGADGTAGLGAAHGGYRTTPGRFGAMESKIGKALLTANHKARLAAGKFTKEDMRRVTLWLDCNSNELGSVLDTGAQKRGQKVWPTEIHWEVNDVDSLNPTGVEKGFTAIIAPGLVSRAPEERHAPRTGMSPERLFVDLAGTAANRLTVHDARGVCVASIDCIGRKSVELPTARLAAGIYYVRLSQGKQLSVWKAMVH